MGSEAVDMLIAKFLVAYAGRHNSVIPHGDIPLDIAPSLTDGGEPNRLDSIATTYQNEYLI